MTPRCYWAVKTCMAILSYECAECNYYTPMDSESTPNMSDLDDNWVPDSEEDENDSSTFPYEEDVFMPCKRVDDEEE